MRSINYVYEVRKTGPCRKCGFSGEVNDYETAKRLGKSQVIVTCPECGGKGQETTWIPLEDAIQDLVERGLSIE